MMMQRGFTIIELLITMTIVGILATLAGPSFSEMLKNNRLTTQTNDLILAMNIARSEAVKRGRSVTITSDTNTNDWSDGWTVAEGGTDLRIGDPLDGTTTLINDKNNTVITYRPSGTATGDVDTSDPGNFDLCDGRDDEIGRRISISTTGRASVSKLDKSTANLDCDP